ncbi:MAG TPA: FecR family protein [Rhodanobacteraceae bacterium]|nr:FecR family protein [Rhodanobacteraceae bacterium]
MRLFADVPAFLRHGWRPAAIVLLCVAAGLARAQATADVDASDPPDRVARLSWLAGDVGFLPAGARDWSDPDVNRPLTGGDRLSTGDGARVELEFGGASVRLAGQTDAGLVELDDQVARLELAQGTLAVTVRHLDEGQSYEIDTPTVALVIDRPGTLRIDVGSGGRGTRVAVFAGQATVYGENNAERDVFAGRSYQFGDPSLGAVAVSDLGRGDAFDAWCADRDQRYAQSQSGQYVSEDVVGYQDLDAYGDWQATDDYGAVWFPRQVGTDWAPYRDGRWVNIRPWGWTWIDDAPWGFAPYHYGRWVRVHGTWGWIPGPRGVRAVYAPALVGFFGGAGWRVSLGAGATPTGWFPLGPGDIYDPWYRASRGYYSRINLRNIRWHDRKRAEKRIDEHYRRHRRGQPPPVRATRGQRDPSGYTVVPGRVRLRPGVRGNGRPHNPGTRPLPAGGFQREVVARPPPATPLPVVHAPRRAAPAPVPAADVRKPHFPEARIMHEHVSPPAAIESRPFERTGRAMARPQPRMIPPPLRRAASAPRAAPRAGKPAPAAHAPPARASHSKTHGRKHDDER